MKRSTFHVPRSASRGFVPSLLLVVVILGALVFPESAFACEHCYGNAGDNETTRGIAMAMGALLGVTSMVGVGVVAFFRRMGRRAKLLEAGSTVVNEYGELIQIQDS